MQIVSPLAMEPKVEALSGGNVAEIGRKDRGVDAAELPALLNPPPDRSARQGAWGRARGFEASAEQSGSVKASEGAEPSRSGVV